jgi:hypothetical protein
VTKQVENKPFIKVENKQNWIAKYNSKIQLN